MKLTDQPYYKLKKGNDICIVKFDNVTLPLDVLISISGDKMIAQSQILDGVAVFERVTRKPYEINFDFTMRSNKGLNGIDIGDRLSLINLNKWTFPLKELSDLFNNVWKKDSVIKVENTLLNELGILQIVINDIQITTMRGNVDVGIKIKTTEDFYSINTQGTNLILNSIA